MSKLFVLNNNDFFALKRTFDINGTVYDYSEKVKNNDVEYKMVNDKGIFTTAYSKKGVIRKKINAQTNQFLKFYSSMNKKHGEIKKIKAKYTGIYKENESVRHNNKTFITFITEDGDLFEVRQTEIWKHVDKKFTKQDDIILDICFTRPSWEAFRICFNNSTWIRAGKFIYKYDGIFEVK